MTFTLHEDQCTFLIISRRILLRMRNVPDRSWRENQNSHFCLITFFRKPIPVGVGLRPLARCDRGLESHRRQGCLSGVSVVCCQVEVSGTDWSLAQRRPIDCGASLCVIKKPRPRGGYSPVRGLQNTNPQWVVAPVEKKSSFQNRAFYEIMWKNIVVPDRP